MMEISQYKQPSLWYSLLWKEFQQVKSTMLAVLIGVFALQLLFIALAVWTPEHSVRQGLLEGAAAIACIAPILIAVGCSGMLIGQERQTGTWGWATSLPVSWRQALGSKFVVSLSTATVVGALSGIVPAILVLNSYITFERTEIALIYISTTTIVVFLEVIAYFFLASLLMRETLTALVVAGLLLIFGQLGLIGLVGGLFERMGYSGERLAIIVYTLVPLVLTLCGFSAMVVTFRWRWGIGQQSVLSLLPTSAVVEPPRAARYRYSSESAPSEWRMMLRHAFVNSLTLRLSVLVASLLLGYMNVTNPFLGILSVFIAGVLGLSVFEGDQTLQRIRFLADRGVSPYKLVRYRLIAGAIWLLPCIGIFFGRDIAVHGMQPDVPAAFIICLIVFLLSAFASMCFRKPVIAGAVALVVCIAWFAASKAVFDFVISLGPAYSLSTVITPSQLIWIACRWSPLIIAILLIGIFGQAKRWIVFDEPKLPLRFAWITLVALLLPMLLAVNFIFTLVPSVPWQGVPIAELSRTPIAVPDLLTSKLPVLNSETTLIPLLEVFNSSTSKVSWAKDNLSREIEALRSQQDSAVEPAFENTAGFRAILAPLISQFEEQLQGPRVTPSDTDQYVAQLSNAIVRTATAALIVSSSEDKSSASRLWRLNRELQELAQQFDPIGTADARSFAMQALGRVRDLQAMGGAEFLRSVIPSETDERSALIMNARKEGTLLRERLRENNSTRFEVEIADGRHSSVLHLYPPLRSFQLQLRPFPGVLRYYPPLRWLVERNIALVLNAELIRLSQQPINPLTRDAREQLEFTLTELQQTQQKYDNSADVNASASPENTFEIPALPLLPQDESN